MRRASLAIGILILLAAWALATTASGSFAGHMLAHMGVVAVAAPLIATGVPNPRMDVTPPWITPLTASLIELLVVWFWHVPEMRLLASRSAAAAALEQGSFLVAGLLLWLSCLAAPRFAGAAGLLFTSMHMTLLGVLLALAPRPLYGAGGVVCFGLSVPAVVDQQIGGVAMLLVGAVSYLAGGVALLHRLLVGSSGAAERAR